MTGNYLCKTMAKAKTISIAILLAALFIFPAFIRAEVQDNPAVAGNVFFLSVDYDGNNYSLNEISLTEGQAPDYNNQPESGYRCDLVSNNDEVLYSFNFASPKKICHDVFDEANKTISGGCKTLDKGNFSLEMPYSKNARNINLYDPAGKMILYADVSSMSDSCGNEVCDAGENFKTCPQDCRSGGRDNICDKAADGTCDPDCAAGQDPDCGKTAAVNSILTLAITVVSLIVAALLGYFVWRKAREAGGERKAEKE